MNLSNRHDRRQQARRLGKRWSPNLFPATRQPVTLGDVPPGETRATMRVWLLTQPRNLRAAALSLRRNARAVARHVQYESERPEREARIEAMLATLKKQRTTRTA